MVATIDRRQLILTQLYDILSGLNVPLLGGPNGPVTIVPGNIVHNRDQLPQELVPGIVLLDADETAIPLPLAPGRTTRVGPALMRMTPEIYIVLDVRSPQNKNVGEDLNTARAAIMDLVLHDKTLLQITGSNGRTTYDGCVTDLARNRVMKGQMGISLTFVYPFIPDEFAAA
jgi:hypothetical protein